MSVLYMDGFDHYRSTDLLKKWTSMDTGAGQLTITSGTGRRGNGALTQTGGAAYGITKNLNNFYHTLILGFGFQVSAMPGGTVGIAWFSDQGNKNLVLQLEADGRLSLLSGTTVVGQSATTPITTEGWWYYVEIRASFGADNGGQCEVRVDGVQVMQLTGITTAHNFNNASTQFSLGLDRTPGGTFNAYWADVYLCDDSGLENNDFLGDCTVDIIYPNEEGSVQQFDPQGAPHYTLVNEFAPNTTNYVSSQTQGQVDLYGMQDFYLWGLVAAVQVNNCAATDVAGVRALANVVKVNGMASRSDQFYQTTSFKYSSSIHEHDPSTDAAWTQDGINSMEAGSAVAL